MFMLSKCKYLVVGLLAFATAEATETVLIYKYLDANGVLHLSNNPPSDGSEILLLYSRSYVIETYTPPPVKPQILPKNKPKNKPKNIMIWFSPLQLSIICQLA
jgi:hypothetical protein